MTIEIESLEAASKINLKTNVNKVSAFTDREGVDHLNCLLRLLLSNASNKLHDVLAKSILAVLASRQNNTLTASGRKIAFLQFLYMWW